MPYPGRCSCIQISWLLSTKFSSQYWGRCTAWQCPSCIYLTKRALWHRRVSRRKCVCFKALAPHPALWEQSLDPIYLSSLMTISNLCATWYATSICQIMTIIIKCRICSFRSLRSWNTWVYFCLTVPFFQDVGSDIVFCLLWWVWWVAS